METETVTVNGQPVVQVAVNLKSLYAKFVVNIEVQPDQIIEDNFPPQFELTGWEVHNVVKTVGFDRADNVEDTSAGKEVYDEVVFTGERGIGEIASSTRTASFFFYLPERFLTPKYTADNYDYPFRLENGSIRDENKINLQKYKPCLVENQNATFVRFKGTYLDHQNHLYDISYDIYVGEDEYSNFDVERNTQYNNNIIIKGAKKSTDGAQNEESVSIDYRVNISRVNPYIISLERETLLDSHFEIRPLRVRKTNDFVSIPQNARIRIEIVNPNSNNWIRLEHKNSADNSGFYCSNGKRKYFTYGLVSGIDENGFDVSEDPSYKSLRNSYCAEVPITEMECVWLYIDENLNEGTDERRSAVIRISYAEDGVNFNYEEASDYIISQHHLYPVETIRKNSDIVGNTPLQYTYLIENYEEYLYNYDSEDSYNQTEWNGMEWGLNGVQLSYTEPAFYLLWTDNSGEWDESLTQDKKAEILNTALKNNGLNPKYDFYLPRDTGNDNLTIRSFVGYSYNQNIAAFLKSNYENHQGEQNKGDNYIAKIDGITLDEQPKSAFAYCYNRNKRKPDGTVAKQSWYLPAIDEIEDIAEFAYASFDGVFQGNMYWSCQPSYIPFYIEFYRYRYYLAWWSRTDEKIDGYYYIDDTANARATKALRENGQFAGVPNSSADVYKEYKDGKIYITATSYADKRNTAELGSENIRNSNYNDINDHPGNIPRTNNKARVRCVYYPGDGDTGS